MSCGSIWLWQTLNTLCDKHSRNNSALKKVETFKWVWYFLVNYYLTFESSALYEASEQATTSTENICGLWGVRVTEICDWEKFKRPYKDRGEPWVPSSYWYHRGTNQAIGVIRAVSLVATLEPQLWKISHRLRFVCTDSYCLCVLKSIPVNIPQWFSKAQRASNPPQSLSSRNRAMMSFPSSISISTPAPHTVSITRTPRTTETQAHVCCLHDWDHGGSEMLKTVLSCVRNDLFTKNINIVFVMMSHSGFTLENSHMPTEGSTASLSVRLYHKGQQSRYTITSFVIQGCKHGKHLCTYRQRSCLLLHIWPNICVYI